MMHPGLPALALSARSDRGAAAVMALALLSGILAIVAFSWVKTTAGAVKTALAAGLAALAGLVSFEVEPVFGLVLLIAFEAVTDYAIVKRPGLTRRQRAGVVLAARGWVLFACGAAVVFANASPPDVEAAVKAGLVLCVGGLSLLVGWYRVGTRAPILALMADVAVQRLKGKGVDFSLVDEEGRNVNVSARIKAIDAGPAAGPPAETPAPSAPPPAPGAPAPPAADV